ncbi:MAG: oxidoreductase [Puniceicoccaceae bacterium 5H]|nr:MAG: oxidoreductase [Puniceicoccaceae bacterium 5H]
MKSVHWAIVGTGEIAGEFVQALQSMPDEATRYVIVSRNRERAEAFAREHGFARGESDLGRVLEDDALDAVYVATPHPAHFGIAKQCLEAGKAVLCEKPVTLNAKQARELVDTAREHRTLFMEAMKTPFQPAIRRMLEIVQSGIIGPVRHLEANFCFHGGNDPSSRWLNPELGGGALLDVGIYPLSLAYVLLGKPLHLHHHAHLGSTGVDERNALLLTYGNGASASLTSGVRGGDDMSIRVACADGQIELLDLVRWDPQKLRWRRYHEDWQEESHPTAAHPLTYEAREVHRCLAEGKAESETVPLVQTLTVMEQMDAIRQAWGLVYPNE